MADETKTKIGRYEIESELGRGGMAVVYRARDTELERVVALKLIRKGAFADEQMAPMIERFHREARALAKLNHPNIVKVLDFGDYEGAPYLVMEYLEGATLKEVKKPLGLGTAVRLIRPIAEALGYVHQKGLLHRDVKPSNIMITTDDRVILTDFGIAKWIEDDGHQATLTGTGVGIGTPEYMAPEQGRGKGTDARSDMYSLSIVFYELITGEKPFQGSTPVDILIKQATDPAPDPREFVPNLPISIVRFFDIALAKSPDERYATIQDYMRDLDGLRLVSSVGTGTVSSMRKRIETVPAPINATGSSVRFGGTDLRKVREATIVDPSLKRIPVPAQRATGAGVSGGRAKTPSFRALAGLGIALIAVIGGVLFAVNRREPDALASTPLMLSSPSAHVLETKTPVPIKTSSPTIYQPELTEHAQIGKTKDALSLQSTEVALQSAALTASYLELLNTKEAAGVALTETAERQWEAEATAALETESAAQSYAGTITALANTQSAMLDRFASETADAKILAESSARSAAEVHRQAKAATATEAAKNPYAYLGVGDHIRFGRYEQDNDASNGPEAIEWRVLDVSGGTALLISRYGLDQAVYHDRYVDVDWENCALRQRLNETFYDMAFSLDEKKYIVESKLKNDDNRTTGSIGGAHTTDRIFLLSIDEAADYFSGAFERILKPTRYALGYGVWVSKESGYEGNAWWWLRSPGLDSRQAARVFHGGAIDVEGAFVNDDRGALRPVFRLRIGD